MKQKNIKGLISEYFIFLIFIALVVVLPCLKPSFIAPTNLVNILKQASINGILAFGMMFVIIAGGFDMSVGSTVAFTGILAALLGKGDLPLIVPLVVAMLAGLAVGMVNGIGVAIGDLPPFIMTLGIAMVASPGAPGGSIMTALPFLYMIFGTEAGDPSGPICAIMVALYITQDSFGTACNVSGDNAIGVIVETIYRRFICKSSAQ